MLTQYQEKNKDLIIINIPGQIEESKIESKNSEESIDIPLDLITIEDDDPPVVIWHDIPLGCPETVRVLEEKKNEPLLFISKCTEEKITAFEKKYQTPRKLLDDVLKENRKKYYAFRTLNFACKTTNILFCYTLIDTSVLALNASYQAATSTQSTLSPAICYGITVPCGVLDLILFNFLIYSSVEESIESTLDYVLKNNIVSEFNTREMIEKFQSPIRYWLKNISNKIICFLFLSGGSVVRMEAIENLLSNKSKVLRFSLEIPVALIGLYFSNKYFSKDYYESKLIEEIRAGTFLKDIDWHTRFQIFMEYLCFVGTFAYPQTYSLAVIAGEIFGWWFPPGLVAAISGFQLTIGTLPKIVKEYTEDNDWVKHLESKEAKELTPQSLKKKSFFKFFYDHPEKMMPLILEMGLGLYGGYQIARAANIPIYLGTVFVGIPVGFALVYSKSKTMRMRDVNQGLRKTCEKESSKSDYSEEKKQEKTMGDKILEGGILIINAGSAAITALFLIGSLAYLMQNVSSEGKDIGMIFILYAALKSMFYFITYNSTKTSETAKIFRDRFFKKPEIAPEEHKSSKGLTKSLSLEEVD